MSLFTGRGKFLTAMDLSKHPDAPLKRSDVVWRKWLTEGIEIDGELKTIWTKNVGNWTFTTLEAVWEVFGDAKESQIVGGRQ